MDISIIIPNLNSPIVDKTIKSIIEQCVDISSEIIVIGLDQYNLLQQFKNEIIIINTGTPVPPGTARNIGVNNSRGDLFIFIDSDAIAQTNFIKGHVEAHKTWKESMIGGSITFPKRPFLQLCDNISTFHEYMPHMPTGKKRMIPTVNMSIIKENFLVINGFNENPAGEDVDFSQKANNINLHIQYIPEIQVQHLPQRNSFKDIMDHSYKLGKYTQIFDKFVDRYSLPEIFRKTRLWIIFFSPIIALLIVIKIIIIEKLPVKYWLTLPIVFIQKVLWCFGASRGSDTKI